jgi:Tfp pilus assembly protein PilN
VKTATVTGLATLPKVNLLPPEIAEKHKVQQVQVGVGAAVLAVIVAMGFLYTQGKGSVSDAKASLATAQAQQTVLQGQINKLQYVTHTATQLDSAEATLTQATATEIHWSDYLGDLSLVIPSSVWVTQMTFSENVAPGSLANPGSAGPVVGNVSLAGTALSNSGSQFAHNGVASWLDATTKEKGFASAWFSNAQEAYIGSVKVSNFASTVNLTSDALTKRCAQPGVC